MPMKVLFFVNSFSRTGSETLIYEFIQDLNRQGKIEIGIVICDRKGELVDLIDKNIPVFYLNQQFSVLDKLLFHTGTDVIGKQIKQIQDSFKANLWYFNTISQIHLLSYRDQFHVQTIVHVHELLYNFESLQINDFKTMLQKCDHLVACSSLVKDIFAPFFQKPITVINSSIKFSEWKSHRKNKTSKSNKIIKIIGSGTVCYRKGTDLFIEVADILRSPFVEFIWLGKKNNNAFSEIIRLKNEKIKSVSFIETNNLEEYLTFLKQGDIFLSTSREESMGLVIMEAQALGMPVVATDSGGSTLLVHEKDGKIVKELNPEAISIGLKEVMNNLSSYNALDKLKYDYTIELQKLSILLQNPLI